MISQLDRDLEELQRASGAYAARHRRISNFGYPPGIRIAVNFTLDFDSMLLRRLLNEPPMQLAKGEFGAERRGQAYDCMRFFGTGEAAENFFPEFFRAAGNRKGGATVPASAPSERWRLDRRPRSLYFFAAARHRQRQCRLAPARGRVSGAPVCWWRACFGYRPSSRGAISGCRLSRTRTEGIGCVTIASPPPNAEEGCHESRERCRRDPEA
jgi:hypothetical protein